MAIQTVNPATGERVREFAPFAPRDIEAKLARADEARHRWMRVPVAERARVVRRAGEILEERKNEYGRLLRTTGRTAWCGLLLSWRRRGERRRRRCRLR